MTQTECYIFCSLASVVTNPQQTHNSVLLKRCAVNETLRSHPSLLLVFQAIGTKTVKKRSGFVTTYCTLYFMSTNWRKTKWATLP